MDNFEIQETRIQQLVVITLRFEKVQHREEDKNQ
jgi:hypothetical protein